MERQSDKLYTSSIKFDKRLYKQDIKGSKVHAEMLGNQGILTVEESKLICDGLEQIRLEIQEGVFQFSQEFEDIHMNVEKALFERIGSLAGKLHTGRSRNDQIALDLRMFVKESAQEIWDGLLELRRLILAKADKNIGVYLPGYTHLQRGQPVSLAHHLLAYYEMFKRDCIRFVAVYESADVMPLGSGALAGTTYSLDREWVANKLGFKNLTTNSMDAVSDRDFLLDFHSASAICSVHISRLCEEIVIWTSEEFDFAKLGSDYTTGSSMMPQKRNPDFAEISRGKTGRVYGNLISMLTILKGLPMTYNRDLQEDKEGFFDSHDTLTSVLEGVVGMLPGIYVNSEKARQSAEGGMVLATDLADYLVIKGVPFREAHGIISELTDYASNNHKMFSEVSLEEYRDFSMLFDEDVYEISVESSISARNTAGGTSFKMVQQAIKAGYRKLGG